MTVWSHGISRRNQARWTRPIYRECRHDHELTASVHPTCARTAIITGRMLDSSRDDISPPAANMQLQPVPVLWRSLSRWKPDPVLPGNGANETGWESFVELAVFLHSHGFCGRIFRNFAGNGTGRMLRQPALMNMLLAAMLAMLTRESSAGRAGRRSLRRDRDLAAQ